MVLLLSHLTFDNSCRLTIKDYEEEALPTLNNQINWMVELDDKAKDREAALREKIEELDDELQKRIRGLESLKHQLREAEDREKDNSFRMAGDIRLAAEESEKLRFELDHLKADIESERKNLGQKIDQVESEKRECLDRIFALEASLRDIKDEYELQQETLEAEVSDGLAHRYFCTSEKSVLIAPIQPFLPPLHCF